MLDTLFVFGAQLLTKLRGLLLMPLLIRGLGTEAFGTWSQVLAFTVLVSAIVGLNLHHSLIRFIAASPKDASRSYTTMLIVSVALPALVGAAVAALAGPGVREAMVGTPQWSILALSLLVVCTMTVRSLNLNLYRATDRLKVRSIVDFVASLVELGAIIVAVALGKGLVHVLSCMALVGAAVALLTTAHGYAIVRFGAPDLELLKKALTYGLPLVPAALAMWVLDRSDRFVISRLMDQRAVGIYSAHYTIGSLILLIQAPIQLALVPKIIQLWTRDRGGASAYMAGTFKFFVAASVLFVMTVPFLAQSLFRILANADVAEGSAVNVALVGLGMSFWGLAVIESSTLYAANRTRTVGLFTTGCAAVNLVLNLTLVPRLGITASALATTVAYGVTWMSYAFANRSVLQFDRGFGFFVRALLAAMPGAALLYFWSPRGVLPLCVASAVATLVYCALLLAVIRGSERRAVQALVQSRAAKSLRRDQDAAVRY